MEGDVAGAGLGKIPDQAIHRADHQVHVDIRGHAMFAQCLTHHRTNGQIGHVVIIHHIEMHDVRTRGEHRIHLLSQTGKIR